MNNKIYLTILLNIIIINCYYRVVPVPNPEVVRVPVDEASVPPRLRMQQGTKIGLHTKQKFLRI